MGRPGGSKHVAMQCGICGRVAHVKKPGERRIARPPVGWWYLMATVRGYYVGRWLGSHLYCPTCVYTGLEPALVSERCPCGKPMYLGSVGRSSICVDVVCTKARMAEEAL